MKYKAIKYIETSGSYEYKKFISQNFDKKLIVNLFEGWIQKDYNIFEKENIKLKFNKQNECYKINDKYILPYPETLNDFISDLKRCNIDLYWKSEILKDLLVKDFYAENELKNYYNNLLRNLDKLNELI